MKNKFNIFNINVLALSCICMVLCYACNNDDDVSQEKTRLFGPVLNEGLLEAIDNTIIVDMAQYKDAINYTVEVSRDSFATVEYIIKSDTSYVVVEEATVGEELFWNVIYQVRAQAHAQEAMYDSKVSDFGNIRTQTFPSILNKPAPFDVTDIAARVTWTPSGLPVTGIQVFSENDLRLENPLFPEQAVTEDEQLAGVAVVENLEPETTYQIAIYSEDRSRGWVNYTTRIADIDPTSPGVIDIRGDQSVSAVIDALASAPDNSTILIARGSVYDAPSVALDKSVTIQAAYGFGEEKAKLLFNGNFDVADGANVGHLRFVGLELRGTDWSGKYVMNMSKTSTLDEISFEDCYITNFRGVLRQKDNANVINNYLINNCVLDSINGYGVVAVDNVAAKLNHFSITNSSVNHAAYFIVSKNDFESLNISDCSFANTPETGRQFLRFRESGQDNVTGGVTIINTIMGHTWDMTDSDNYGMQGIDGLENTSFDLLNNYTTANFSFTRDEIPGFPVANYTNAQDDLWIDPNMNDFHIKDKSFIGRYDSGDTNFRDKI
ncbi:DUF4957 domain-containing protein [Pseudotamlana carrageenivorans]|uniref:DUF5123 domain-containing protein n=1 Tax=Pseudotamlana carrageenivorans TaxID=2069432 RepID=A0A2I7SNA1_9FLAO|nr:DUF4957 domain-containing protein [Tamlana carrageenivorans]AUS07385.1 DUF5123 domain-containing protein [Tamlana carrageenivorans]